MIAFSASMLLLFFAVSTAQSPEGTDTSTLAAPHVAILILIIGLLHIVFAVPAFARLCRANVEHLESGQASINEDSLGVTASNDI